MAFIHIGSIATSNEHQAEIEDPTANEMTLEHFASPQFTAAAVDYTVEFLEALLDEATKSLEDEGFDKQELVFDAFSDWDETGYRAFKTQEIRDTEGNIVAMIVIQRIKQ